MHAEATDRLRVRIERMQDTIKESHPDADGLAFVMVICNGCGRERTVISSDLAVITPCFSEWRLGELGEDADYCPECLSCEHCEIGVGVEGYVSGIRHLCPRCHRLVCWDGSTWIEAATPA